MRLCWADKLAVAWGVLLFCFLWFFALVDMHPNFATWGFIKTYGLVVGLPWLILRGLDLLTDGPGRRRGEVRVRPISPH